MSQNHEHEHPLGGKIFTPAFFLLLAIIAAGGVVILIRLFFGLGSVSEMSDAYPWGIWKPLNVVTFTGIAAGAYSVGWLTYIFNRGEYHPLVRSAVMAGTMGYTLAGTSVLIDLGRWWNLWVTFWPPVYNLNSVLLEVAICVMAYTGVLWVEITPAVLERLRKDGPGPLKELAIKFLPLMNKAMPFIVSIAILLPTMHQSSLGGLYMVTETKLHPLWHTSWISGLFLLSCLSMGFGAVIVLENITNLVYGRRMDLRLLSRLAPVGAGVVAAYLVLRLVDLAMRGRLGLIFTFDFYSLFFLLEMAIFAGGMVLLFLRRTRTNRGWMFLGAFLLLLSGALYRFDTYLIAYLPLEDASYFPSIGEMLMSACLAAIGILVYIVMAKMFPILSGVAEGRRGSIDRSAQIL